MKMKTIVLEGSTRIAGSRCKVEFQVEDDCTEEEIHAMATQALFELIEWNWYEK